ncbi:sodium:solute symporter family protein [Nocardiopsis kunsanensis]|uniref:sodium:solute symporter family protein n=1 Tax=Nocardiopsis kunsanensis TaxID=141693 RepID=UPI000371BF74|nr:sodium:solute symporter family protein [Nocardiopsis kunsanensis]
MQTTHLVILGLYLLAMVGIGLYFSRSSKVGGGDDFLFAGRSLSTPVMIATLLVTWVGSGTIIGGANFAYNHGPIAGMIFFAGTPLGILVLLLIARRIRRAARHTIPELLEARFGTGVRTVAALVTAVAYIGLVAAQFVGGGYVLALITPLDDTQGTLVVAVVASVPIVLLAVGGPSDYWQGLPEVASTPSGGLTGLQLLGYFLPLFLLLLADQNLYQRLAAAKDERSARNSTLGMLFSSFFVFVPVVLLATAAAILVPGVSGDESVLRLASEGHLPVVMGGVLLAGAVAFVITTGSSFMLSGASNIAFDLFARFGGERIGDRGTLFVQRVSVLAIALVAIALGLYFPTVLDLQMYSYTIYGAGITPAVFAVLFWKRATTAGAVAALVAGTAATIGWETAGAPGDLNGVIIALPTAVVSLVLVSLLTKAPDARSLEAVGAD